MLSEVDIAYSVVLIGDLVFDVNGLIIVFKTRRGVGAVGDRALCPQGAIGLIADHVHWQLKKKGDSVSVW